MAEIIGIVSGLVNISETGFRISKVLYNFAKSVIKAPQQISELAHELDSISSAFQCLADVLETSGGLLKPALINTTQAILDDCERTYAEIEEIVQTVERQSLKAKEKVQWAFRKAKVKQLRTRLESAKATLSLMVNILNLSAGIKFLRRQNEPPKDLVDDTNQRFETSTEAVIDTQLAFDKAERSEKRLAAQESSRSSRHLNSSSSQSKPQSNALVKARPQSDIAAEIPGFELLSLVRWNEKRRDGYDSEDSQDENDESLARQDDLKRQAPAIVTQLCYGWTDLEQDDHQGLARISEHPSAGDVSGDDNLKTSQGNASDAKATRPPKLRGLSLYDANQDEAPARFSSYSSGTSRRESGGPNPTGGNAQKSPRLRKEGNESKWDPFFSVLPERSEYTSGEKTPRPEIFSRPRGERVKARASGDLNASNHKQAFSQRPKSTRKQSKSELDDTGPADVVDSTEESDSSASYFSGHPRRRQSTKCSANSRPAKNCYSLNDEGERYRFPSKTTESGVAVALPFDIMNVSHDRGDDHDMVKLRPVGDSLGGSLRYIVLRFTPIPLAGQPLMVSHVHEAVKMIVDSSQYIRFHLSCSDSRPRIIVSQPDIPMSQYTGFFGSMSGQLSTVVWCRAIRRSPLKRTILEEVPAEELWRHMRSRALALNWECVDLRTCHGFPPITPGARFQGYGPATQSAPVGAGWQARPPHIPTVPVPPKVDVQFDVLDVLYVQTPAEWDHISIFFEPSSFRKGTVTMVDILNKVFRLVPPGFVIIVTTTGGVHLLGTFLSANSVGLTNSSTIICSDGHYTGFDPTSADPKIRTKHLWGHMVRKAQELQSQGELYSYTGIVVASGLPSVPYTSPFS